MATPTTAQALICSPSTTCFMPKNLGFPPIYGIKFIMLHVIMVINLLSTLYHVNGLNTTSGMNYTVFANVTTITTTSLPLTTPGPTTEVRLTTGPKPNIGRVQIRLSVNDAWIPVCSRNESALNVDDSWDKREINVVCKHLGYRGGWYKEYGRTVVREQFVAYVQCQGNETNIGKCNLLQTPYETGLGCGNSQYAGAQCYTKTFRPGYLGCFPDVASTLRVLPDHPSTGPTIGHKWKYSNMTISLCIERCASLDLQYAGLEARDECFCGREDRRYDQYGRLDDDKCSQACAGNEAEECGAEYLLSVYDVPTAMSAGKCRDPGLPKNGFTSDKNITRERTPEAMSTVNYNSTNGGNMTSDNYTVGSATTLPPTTTLLTTTLPPTSPTMPTVPPNTTSLMLSNITYDFHSIVFFACDDDYELEGVTSLECVIGSTPYEVVWSGDIPTCYLPTTLAPTTTPITTTLPPTTTTLPTTTLTTTVMSTTLPPLPTIKPARQSNAGPLVGVVLACLLFLILFLVAVHFYIKKRKQKHATQPISTPREPRVDEEAALATNLALSEVEAYSNGTNESAILDTNETGGPVEEEIDLRDVPETHASSNEHANDAWTTGETSGAVTAATESGYNYDNNGGDVNNTDYANGGEYEYVYEDGTAGGGGEGDYEYVYEDEYGNIIEGEYANADGYGNNDNYNTSDNAAYDYNDTGHYANDNDNGEYNTGNHGDHAGLVNNDGNSNIPNNRR